MKLCVKNGEFTSKMNSLMGETVATEVVLGLSDG